MNKKKIKLSLFTSLLVSVVILVCMAVLCIILYVDVSNSMSESAGNTLQTTLNAQKDTLADYIAKEEQNLQAFGQAPAIKNLLKNPGDPAATETAQAYLEDYYEQLEGWEGLYIADWTSTQLAHINKGAIGVAFRTEPDTLKAWQDSMLQSEDGLVNQGAFVSPTTGRVLINMRQVVYDDDGVTPIGAVGGGPFIETLGETMNKLVVAGMPTAEYMVVDSDSGIYVLNNKAELIGKEIDEPAIQGILDEARTGIAENKFVTTFNGDEQTITWRAIPQNHMILIVYDQQYEILAGARSAIKLLIICCIVVVLIIIAGVSILASWIAKPFVVVAGKCENLAGGSLNVDFNVKSPIKETDDIVNATSHLQHQLANIVGNIKDKTDNLNSDAASLISVADITNASIENVNEAVAEIAQGSVASATDTEAIAVQCSELETITSDVTEAMTEMKEAADEALEISSEAKDTMNALKEVSDGTKDIVDGISAQMQEVNERLVDVGSIVTAISDITGQTNLLSLNASIEAARAGDAGRGFAVVAGEIRNLAESSAENATRINDIVNGLVGEIHKISSLTEQLVEQSENQATQLGETGAQLDKCIEEITAISGNVEKVNSRTQGLTDATRAVNDAVSNLSAVTEENAASSQQTTAAMHESSEQVHKVAANANSVKGIADTLKQLVSYFKD